MARDTEIGYVYRSEVRTGFKREFAFALKSQNEVLNSINTSRSRKRSKPGSTDLVQIKNGNDGSAVNVDDDKKKGGFRRYSGGEGNSRAEKAKVVPKLRLKDLLMSGSLAGSRVHYRRKLKLEAQEDAVVYGIIKGFGIECHCDNCKGNNVVLTPNQFEIHAGSRNKKPLDYICLEDGRTLKMALNDFIASQAKFTHNPTENVGRPVAEAVENPSDRCSNINHTLQNLVERGDQQIPAEMLEHVGKKLASKRREKLISNVRWRILNGNSSDMKSNRSLFDKVISIFHDRFSEITEPGKRKSIIPDMVFGKDELQKNYGGMHTAIITLNSKVISAILFRVHGNEIVELPLAATSKRYEKKGYFRVLYSCLEAMLAKVDIEYLYLPAAHEAKKMWIDNFNFSDLPDDKLIETEEKYSLMMFDGTSMLYKCISRGAKTNVTKSTSVGTSSVANVT